VVGLLELPVEREDATFREGFWKWVDLLARGDFAAAVSAIRWGEGASMSPEQLEQRIAAFFNESDHMVPIIPNQRLIDLIDEKMEVEWCVDELSGEQEDGWAMALLPVTHEPHRAKEDDVSLMGIALSFFLVKEGSFHVLEFERFHV